MSTFRLKNKEVENVKATRQQIKARLTWKQKVCIINKDFFITIKPKLYKMGISILKDDVKAITTSHIKPKKIILGIKSYDIRSLTFP
jgi:hypothetical protein